MECGKRFEPAEDIAMPVVQFFSRFSRNSEISASEYLGFFEEMLSCHW